MMMNNMITIVGILFVVAAIVLGVQYMWRYIYNYRITEAGVEILLFGRTPIKTISFDNIAEIRKVSIIEGLGMGGLGLRNRALGTTVLIRQRRGIIRDVFITPDNADNFINEVLQRVSL